MELALTIRDSIGFPLIFGSKTMVVIRWILGRVILLIDAATSPKGVIRSSERQEAIEQETSLLSLYQFYACPFCVKVRRAIKRHSLNIPTRDAKADAEHRQELLTQGGKIKVPCLRIDDGHGQVQWLYESDKIIEYLENRFAATP